MLFEGMGTAARYANTLLSRLQTGRMRDYAVGLLLGAILVAAIALAR